MDEDNEKNWDRRFRTIFVYLFILTLSIYPHMFNLNLIKFKVFVLIYWFYNINQICQSWLNGKTSIRKMKERQTSRKMASEQKISEREGKRGGQVFAGGLGGGGQAESTVLPVTLNSWAH